MDAPLSVVESRDPKGLYKKARAGEIKGGEEVVNYTLHLCFLRCPFEGSRGTSVEWVQLIAEFTGVSAPYEPPQQPEIHIRTDQVDVAGAVAIIVEYLEKHGLIPASSRS